MMAHGGAISPIIFNHYINMQININAGTLRRAIELAKDSLHNPDTIKILQYRYGTTLYPRENHSAWDTYSKFDSDFEDVNSYHEWEEEVVATILDTVI